MNIPNSFLKRSGKDIIVRGERGSSRKNYGCIRKYMHLALDSLSKREARSYNYIDKLYSIITLRGNYLVICTRRETYECIAS